MKYKNKEKHQVSKIIAFINFFHCVCWKRSVTYILPITLMLSQNLQLLQFTFSSYLPIIDANKQSFDKQTFWWKLCSLTLQSLQTYSVFWNQFLLMKWTQNLVVLGIFWQKTWGLSRRNVLFSKNWNGREKPQIDFKKVTPNIVPSLDSFSLKFSVTIMEFMNWKFCYCQSNVEIIFISRELSLRSDWIDRGIKLL